MNTPPTSPRSNGSIRGLDPTHATAGIGTRMSRKIQAVTGKKPCGFCRKVRDSIDAAEKAIKKFI